MERLNALLAARRATIEKIDALLKSDNLTPEQQTEHDRLVAESDQQFAAIGREQARLARAEQQAKAEADAVAAKAKADAEAAAAAERAARTVPVPNRLTDFDQPIIAPQHAQAGIITIPANIQRCGQLQHFRGVRNGLDAEQRAYMFGQWALASLSQQMPNRYRFNSAVEFVTRHASMYGPRFAAAHNSNDSTGAQFLIPEQFATDMIILREQYGVARRLFKMQPMTSDTRTDPRRKGGLTAYFTAESGAITESTKSWDNVRLTAKELACLSRYSRQVQADAAINFGDDLAGEISYAFANKEDLCGFTGDGTSTYGGIVGVLTKLLNCDGAGTASAGLVVEGTSNTWSAFVLGDFDKVVGKLPQYADTPNACWTMHRTFFYEVVEKLVQAAGGTMSYEIRDGQRGPQTPSTTGRIPIFKGYPVIFSQVYPATTTVTTVVCSLGDHALGASFGDRQMEEIAFSEHASVGGENVFERNQIAIRGLERIDINVHDAGTASVTGPIVGLRTGT